MEGAQGWLGTVLLISAESCQEHISKLLKICPPVSGELGDKADPVPLRPGCAPNPQLSSLPACVHFCLFFSLRWPIAFKRLNAPD